MMTSKFPIGDKVTVNFDGVDYRAVVIEPPPGHGEPEGSICVRFTPPVVHRSGNREGWLTMLTAVVGGTQITAGWPEDAAN